MNLQLDDESYSLSLCYAGDFGKLGLAIDFYENEGETVLNFRRNCGCAVNFNKGLSCFIEKFITPIFVKEEIKEEKKEEWANWKFLISDKFNVLKKIKYHNLIIQILIIFITKT